MAFDLKLFMERILGFEKNFVKFIIDPLHGQIGITKLEEDITKTKTFKRLKNIQQLGFASSIYPAATHKRYEHCIGTLHTTWTMLKQFIKNYAAQEYWCNHEILEFFSDEMLTCLRLAALLHDLGHGPYSHSFEQVANSLGQKIDHDSITTYLLTYEFPEESLQDLFPNKEMLTSMESSKDIGFFREELKIIPLTTRETIIGIYDRDYKLRLHEPKGFASIRLFLNNLLKGDFGSDRIDYLLRDTYFSGLGHRFNFSDLLENLRGMYDTESKKLLLAVDAKGRSIVEFLMMTRYYHYKLIAHHPRNILEEIKFQESVKKGFKVDKKIDFFSAAMDDDSIERGLPPFEQDIDIVGVWNMGTIGIDHYRFFFYRIADDPNQKEKYEKKIKQNIVARINKENQPKIEDDDIFLAFITEKPHIPILQIYQPEYRIEKEDAVEKYSVLLHDHSILIKGLARTYLEDSSMLVFTRKDCLERVSKFTRSTHHFYLNTPLFEDCMSNVHTLRQNRYDFLLLAIYQITKGGSQNFSGISALIEKIRELQEKHKLDFYDLNGKDFFDPDYGSFCYPKVSRKEQNLVDDLFLFDAAGLIEIKMHLVNRTYQGKPYHSYSYFFCPTRRHKEIGLLNPMIPLESALKIYPSEFKKNCGLDSLV
jgi:HD superfamily phosphohydrolase